MGTLEGWPQIGTELLLPRSELRAGGSAANTALAARHIGLKPVLVGAIGDDHFGHWLADQFHGIRVDLETCRSDTTLSVGLMHIDGERNFFTTCGHLQQFSFEHAAASLSPAPAGAVALFTGPFLLPRLRCRYDELLRLAAGKGYQVALDTGWPPEGWNRQVREEVRRWLAHCDHLLINELEACNIAGNDDLHAGMQTIAQAMQPGASVVVKRGAHGAIALQHGQCVQFTSSAIDGIFDTIGAGDAFNAGYLAARINGADLHAALASGCATAAAILPRFPRKSIRAGELSACAGWEHTASPMP